MSSDSRRDTVCVLPWTHISSTVDGHRTHMNDLFADEVDLPGLLAATGPDGSIDRFPIHLDLRFGNTCNLSCIMCSFPVSSRHGAGRTPAWTTANIDPYRDDEHLWRTLREYAHEIRHLYIAGGEPFMQPGHRRLLELLTETGTRPPSRALSSSAATASPSWSACATTCSAKWA